MVAFAAHDNLKSISNLRMHSLATELWIVYTLIVGRSFLSPYNQVSEGSIFPFSLLQSLNQFCALNGLVHGTKVVAHHIGKVYVADIKALLFCSTEEVIKGILGTALAIFRLGRTRYIGTLRNNLSKKLLYLRLRHTH